jgi:hypothetical protein
MTHSFITRATLLRCPKSIQDRPLPSFSQPKNGIKVNSDGTPASYQTNIKSFKKCCLYNYSSSNTTKLPNYPRLQSLRCPVAPHDMKFVTNHNKFCQFLHSTWRRDQLHLETPRIEVVIIPWFLRGLSWDQSHHVLATSRAKGLLAISLLRWPDKASR